MKIKPGQYDVSDGRYAYRYLVYKVMKKTAHVITSTSYMGSEYKHDSDHGIYYRYPLGLLGKQIENARYTEFKIT